MENMEIRESAEIRIFVAAASIRGCPMKSS